MRKRLLWIASIVVVALIILAIVNPFSSVTSATPLYYTVAHGPFQVEVTTTGELRSAQSEDITGPENLRKIGIYQVKITDLIPEGTVVEAGDYVASLDQSEIANKLNELETELQLERSTLEQAGLDTLLELSKARNTLIDLEYAVEEKELALTQSQYEPAAVQKQAEFELDKARRAYQQALDNYKIQKRQAEAQIYEIQTTLNLKLSKYNQMLETMKDFTITAPKPGMVIYARGWGGDKVTVGGNVSAWDPVVATLPDLSRMLSKTFVNEVDISKIKRGQQVDIRVDAFPGRNYTGEVQSVANVGQERSNSSAKVFEVEILLNESDTSLRPSMTTSNVIHVASYDSVIFVPQECIAENDTATYVYLQADDELVRKEIIKGPMNDNHAIVKYGLEPGDRITFTQPNDDAGLAFLAISPEIENKYKHQPKKLPPDTTQPDLPPGIKMKGKDGKSIIISTN